MRSEILNGLQIDVCNEYVTKIDQINQILDAVSIVVSKIQCYLFLPKDQISFVSDKMMSLNNSLSIALFKKSYFLLIHLKHQTYALIYSLPVQIDAELMKSKECHMKAS
jgi:hypothetical protein